MWASDVWNIIESIVLVAFYISTYLRLTLFFSLKPDAVIFEDEFTDFGTIAKLYSLMFNFDILQHRAKREPADVIAHSDTLWTERSYKQELAVQYQMRRSRGERGRIDRWDGCHDARAGVGHGGTHMTGMEGMCASCLQTQQRTCEEQRAR